MTFRECTHVRRGEKRPRMVPPPQKKMQELAAETGS